MRKGLTCLIVDDVQNIRMVTKQILMNLGCASVLEASTGEEALKQLSEGHAVDLVLLDMVLPQMSGIDCLKAIRVDPKTSHIRCVILTSDRVEAHVREAIAVGAAGYVIKPFSPRTLQAHLDLALADRDKAMEKSS
jgi:two-component system chemotaxis response regulator CheY